MSHIVASHIMARPRKAIDPQKVARLAAEGCTAEEIGVLLDAKRTTIQTRFRQPYEKGHTKLCHTLKRTLVKQALGGNTAALIFAAKVYCGLKENPDTVINVSATATGGLIQFTEETKKELEAFHFEIQQRVYKRCRHLETVSNGNGNGHSTPEQPPALN